VRIELPNSGTAAALSGHMYSPRSTLAAAIDGKVAPRSGCCIRCTATVSVVIREYGGGHIRRQDIDDRATG